MKLNAFLLVSNVTTAKYNTLLRHSFSSDLLDLTDVTIATIDVRVLRQKLHLTHTLSANSAARLMGFQTSIFRHFENS